MPVSPTKYDRPHVGCLARAEVTNTRRRTGIINKYTANIAHPSDFKSYDLHASEHKIRLVNMSGRLVTARLATLARRTALHTPRLYTTHSLPAGGLLRNEAGLRLIKRRPWPLGSYALHNLPATRSISFARVVPKARHQARDSWCSCRRCCYRRGLIHTIPGRPYAPFNSMSKTRLTQHRGRELCH